MAGRFEPNRGLRRDLTHLVDERCRTDAQVVLRTAIITAPVDTGAYKNSLHTERTPRGYRVVADVDHAIFVEFGTRYMRAYRTLGRALDAVKER